jgi:hypothetical protein
MKRKAPSDHVPLGGPEMAGENIGPAREGEGGLIGTG